jgi:hypothetical protein
MNPSGAAAAHFARHLAQPRFNIPDRAPHCKKRSTKPALHNGYRSLRLTLGVIAKHVDFKVVEKLAPAPVFAAKHCRSDTCTRNSHWRGHHGQPLHEHLPRERTCSCASEATIEEGRLASRAQCSPLPK